MAGAPRSRGQSAPIPQRVPSAACQPLSAGLDPRRRRGWGSCRFGPSLLAPSQAPRGLCPCFGPWHPAQPNPGHPRAAGGGSHFPPGRLRCWTLQDARAGKGGDPGGGGSPNLGMGRPSGPGSQLGDISVLVLEIFAISWYHGVRLGAAFLQSPDSTSETALSAGAWFHLPLCLRPFPAPAGPRSLAAGVRGWHLSLQSAKQGVGAHSPERRAGTGGTVKRAGLADRLGNGGAQAPCSGRAPLPGQPRRGSLRAAGFSVKGCPG